MSSKKSSYENIATKKESDVIFDFCIILQYISKPKSVNLKNKQIKFKNNAVRYSAKRFSKNVAGWLKK